MQTQSTHGTLRIAVARAPTGLRRLSLAMLATERTAAAFAGLPEGAGRHGQVLANFKAAAPYLGIPPRAVHAIDWLFKFTQPQDWGFCRKFAFLRVWESVSH
jgi:replication initiation protein RepC